MKKLITYFLLLISFNAVFSVEIYYPPKTIFTNMNYSWNGKIRVTDKIWNINIISNYVPENCTNIISNFDYFGYDENGNFAQKNLSSAENDIDLYLSCNLRLKNNITFLKKNPLFPENINNSYLNETEKVIINKEIKTLASEITDGTNTTLEACAKIASWVHTNINYTKSDEAYDYVNEILNSTTILKRRRGVCDEFSTLFLSLTRAVGIPSRYVAGFSLNQNSSAPHAWAQALIGDQWIDFDPTYGEYGFVDATHIATYFSKTPSFNPYKIIFSTRKGKATIIEPNTSVKVLSYENDTQNLIKINAYFDKKKAGENEYIILNINAENPLNSHVLTTMEILYNKNLLQLVKGSTNDYLYIPPLKNSTKYFIFKTTNNLKKGYYYPTKTKIITFGSKDAEASIDVYPEIGKQTLEEVLSKISLEELKYRTGLEIKNISITPRISYENNMFYLSFYIKNTGNKILDNFKINISYSNITKTIIIPRILINEQFLVNESLITPRNGEHKLIISFLTDKNYFYTISLIKAEEPHLDLKYVGNTTFYNYEPINFSLKIEGKCENKKVVLSSDICKKIFFPQNNTINPIFKYYETKPKNITIYASISCIDKYGTEFKKNKIFYLNREANNFAAIKIRLSYFINSIKNFLNTLIYK